MRARSTAIPQIAMLTLGTTALFRAQIGYSVHQRLFSATRSITDPKLDHTHTHSHSHLHSHSHSHNHTELYEKGWSNPGTRITLIGLAANCGLAISKGIGGVVFHSQSLLADALHAAADLVSDFVTLFTLKYTRRPPSKLYPDGYGGIEAMGTFAVSSLLVYAGVSMGGSALVTCADALFDLHDYEFLHSLFHSHSHASEIADWNAAYIAVGSLVVKELLYRKTKAVGIKENSPVLIANAWHHRVDSLASVVAAVSIAGGQLMNWYWLDPFGGLIVSVMIVKAGWGGLKENFKQLIGKTAPIDGKIIEKVNLQISTAKKDLHLCSEISLGHIQTRGSTYVVYLTCNNCASIDMTEVHKLAEYLQTRDKQIKRVYLTA